MLSKTKKGRVQLVIASLTAVACHCLLFVFLLGGVFFGIPMDNLWEPAALVAAVDLPFLILLYPARERAYAPSPKPGRFVALICCWSLIFFMALAYYGVRLGAVPREPALVSSCLMLIGWPALFGLPLYYLLKTRPKWTAKWIGRAGS